MPATPRRSGRRCRRSTRREGGRVRFPSAGADDRNGRRSITMYAFNYHRPTTRAAGGQPAGQAEDAKLLAGGHSLLPTMKLRLAGPTNLIDLSQVEGLTGIELKGRSLVDRRDDAARRGRELAGRAGGACRRWRTLAGADRRSGGAPSRHDRRLDRQQRSERRLSGGLPRARRDHHHQQAQDRGRRLLHRACSTTALEAGRDHHQGAASRSPRRRPTRSSATRPRASRWSACSCRKRGSEVRVAVTGAGVERRVPRDRRSRRR